MICPKCNNRLATIRYAEVVDGVVTERFLCPECLAKMQQDSAAGFNISAAAPAADKPSASDIAEDAMRTQRTCPGCNTLLSDIIDTGRVGCARCYETFAVEIDDRLEALHHAVHHKGKALRVDDAKSRLMADLQTKRGLLRSVLRAEKYEEAARLRDEIKQLETALYGARTRSE